MIQVNDYSHLSPEEARARFTAIANRIFAEQFHQNFFVKHTDPYQHLKYEIQAFLEGRITEFHGWTDLWGQVTKPIQDAIESWVKWVKDAIFEKIWNTVADWTKWVKDVLKGYIENAIDWATSAYNMALSVYDYLTGTVKPILDDIRSVISDLGTIVYNKAREAINVVYNWLISLWDDYIKPGVESIISGFRGIWDSTLSYAQQAVDWAQNAYNTIQQAWEDIVDQVSGSFEALSKQTAALPQAIASGFQSAISYLKDVFTAIWNDVLVPFGQQLADGLQWIGAQLETVFINLMESLENIFKAVTPVTPEAAPNLSITALKVAGMAAGGLLAMTAVWDLVHPFKDVIPGEIKAMLYDVTNYKMILGALTGALTAVAIAQPMKYYYNATFRPYIPSWGDLMELLSRAYIGDEDFKRFMHYYGYDDLYFDYFKELANTPVRYFGLAAVARTGYFDEEFFKEELDRSGYSERAKEVMLQMYQQTANEALRGYYGSVVISRYREGIIDRDGLAEELKMLGYPEKQRAQLITGAELYYDLDTVLDYVDAIRYSYRRGKITIDELRAELANLGIRADRIERIVAVELARAKEDVGTTQEEEVRAYGRGTAIKRFREGLTTEADLEQELALMGYSAQWIERLKLVARLERDYDFAMTVLSYVKTAYRKKKIDDARFIEILRSFGFVDDKILLELDLIKLAYGLGLTEEEIAS